MIRYNGVYNPLRLRALEKHKFYHITLGLYGQGVQALPGLPPLQLVKNTKT